MSVDIDAQPAKKLKFSFGNIIYLF
jgi:hypothetical protein